MYNTYIDELTTCNWHVNETDLHIKYFVYILRLCT